MGRPFVLAGLALLAVGLTIRRWKRTGGGDDDDPDGGLSDADAERLERDMAGYDL